MPLRAGLLKNIFYNNAILSRFKMADFAQEYGWELEMFVCKMSTRRAAATLDTGIR